MLGRGNWSQRIEHRMGQWSTMELLALIFREWKVFAALTTFWVVFAGIIYGVAVPYSSSGSLLINDAQNSSLQAFSNNLLGESKTATPSKKGNNLLTKHMDYMHTNEFFARVVESIQAKKDSYQGVEAIGYQQFVKYFGADLDKPETVMTRVAGKMNHWAKIGLSSDFELDMGFSTPSREMTYFLSGQTMEVALQVLKEREVTELEKVTSLLQKQQSQAQEQVQSLNAQLAEFQNRPENVMTLTSKEKIGEYLSDLMVRSNETDLKIAENAKIIQFLRGNNKSSKNSIVPAYGTRSQVDSLLVENELLVERKHNLKVAIDKVLKQSQGTPEMVQMVDDLKSRAELEFNQYKEATQALAKVAVQKISVDYRFEIHEKARIETTQAAVSLASMIFLAILLAQIFGSAYVYVRFVWMSEAEHAHFWTDKFSAILHRDRAVQLDQRQQPDNLVPMHPLN